MRGRQRREELTARTGLLGQAPAEGPDDPAGDQRLDGPFLVHRLLPLDLRIRAGAGRGLHPPLEAVVTGLLEAEEDRVMLVIEELQEPPDRDPALVPVADLVG